MTDVLHVPALPDLGWTNGPSEGSFDADAGSLTLRARAGVDWSNDSTGGPHQHAASALVFAAPNQPFTLSARVSVSGERTTFDAGALAIWDDTDHWAKLCFEYSPQGEAMVVSVVTDRFSDDANSDVVTASSIHLRIASLGGGAWAFHSSADGETWRFTRVFSLAAGAGPITVGFLSQAPMGDTCEARFDDIRFALGAPADLRDGS